MYQEEEESSITHLGFTYRLNPLLRIADGLPTDYLHVSEMQWLFHPARIKRMDQERIARADLKAPLLVLRFGNRIYVLDGAHRMARAIEERRYMLPCKVLSVTDLRQEFQCTSANLQKVDSKDL